MKGEIWGVFGSEGVRGVAGSSGEMGPMGVWKVVRRGEREEEIDWVGELGLGLGVRRKGRARELVSRGRSGGVEVDWGVSRKAE